MPGPKAGPVARRKPQRNRTANPKAKAKANPKAKARGATRPRARSTALTSRSGYRMAAAMEDGRERLTVEAPDGRLVLKMLLLPEGPVVEVHGQALRLSSAGELRLECEDLTVDARRDVVVRAGGVIASEGHAQRIHARLGDVQVSANDDVSLDGERVRLNSPRSAPPAATSVATAAALPLPPSRLFLQDGED